MRRWTHPGVGLAGAARIGIMRHIIAVHVPGEYVGEGEPDIRRYSINPEIVKGLGREVATEDAGLSIPGWIGDVPRAGNQ